MKRRQALQKTALLLGTAATLPFVGILQGCQTPQPANPTAAAAAAMKAWQPRVLNAEQNETMAALAECIIPTTDTPGGKSVKVNEFVDDLLAEWFLPDEKAALLDRIDQVNKFAQNAHKQTFAKCTAEQQNAIVAKMASTNDDAWKQFKALTIEGYYTSEIGATMELRYQDVFPEFRGDVLFSELGRAWA